MTNRAVSRSNQSNAEQFKQSFREEAREIVADLETALLEMSKDSSDPELVSRVFRGLHTIKGSGAMFGFEKLAAFTHNLENAFDQVRGGKLQMSSELIDLTLAALDQIRAMIEEDLSSSTADPAACEAVLAKVQKLCGTQTSVAAPSSAPVEPAAEPTGAGPLRTWHLHFAPGAEMMVSGANPLLLLRELRQLGGLSARASMAAVPPLGDLDPERCYVAWDMVLATASGPDAIRDVFIFVEDSCELIVEPATAEPVLNGTISSEPDAQRRSDARDAGAPPPESGERRATEGRRFTDNASTTASLRIPAAKLDELVDLVGELVTVQARLSEVASNSTDPNVAAVSEEIERLTASLRENSMNIRMLPIRATFEKFRRLVHDLARDLGKQVELTMEGADTELDKTVIDQLGDPLMHLIRNSMDHGIETAQKRIERGKRPTAGIHLSARHAGASVLIGVSDDGGGIDADAVRNRAIEKGLIPADASLTQAETFALLFRPGFSTAKEVTDVSGRGVGMDVVRQRVESLRGSIEVASQPCQGTEVTLRLPLTMAIIDGLLTSVDDAYFVLPLAHVLECVELTRGDVERANGKQLARVRGELVPYIRLRRHFDIRTAPPAVEQIMVAETSGGRFGFVVDQVLGNCQTVIKSLGRFYRSVQAVSGATILGNGAVALILDPERLAQDAVRAEQRNGRGRASVAPGNRPGNSFNFKALGGSGSAGPGSSANV
jgi:two-component system chemotaxis sensor kinase CheA